MHSYHTEDNAWLKEFFQSIYEAAGPCAAFERHLYEAVASCAAVLDILFPLFPAQGESKLATCNLSHKFQPSHDCIDALSFIEYQIKKRQM